VVLGIVNFGKARTRLLAWFPEREFFMRSQGRVRFIKISSRLQMAAASGLVLLLAGWGVAMGVVAFGHLSDSYEHASLLRREAKVAKAESRVKAYRNNLGQVVDDLQRRQAFLEQMDRMLPNDVRAGETVSDSRGEAAKTVRKVSAAIPEAGALARVEARQLALVERMTRFADRRAAAAEGALRKLGLNPSAMVRGEASMGGPLERLSTERNGSIDPRFQRLGLSLARMGALENELSSVPQFMPADISMISSGFGYRTDPIDGGGAFHPGLDFRGPIGSPIHAAARGTVSFVGQRSGYGNVVEISHGNGLLTRYAHMSAQKAHIGQQVQAGDVIGLIGSTGRSTGPHLHFEVRINDRAVNPRPFLETAPHVLEEARAKLPRRTATARG
jgi:murein DD-endopeptidase MepM/ murein hydrolase activator NlpD